LRTSQDCRPSESLPQDRAILYFRLGAWTFAALIAPDLALDCWKLGIGVGLDPDALTDAD
jgi:hypothetical protein